MPKCFVRHILLSMALSVALTCCNHAVRLDPSAARSGSSGPAITVAIGEITGLSAGLLVEAIRTDMNQHPGLRLVDPNQAEVIINGHVETFLEDLPGQDLVKIQRATGRTEEVVVRDSFVNKNFTVTKPVMEISTHEIPFVSRTATFNFKYTLSTPGGGAPTTADMLAAEIKEKFGGINQQRSSGLQLSDCPAPEETTRQLAREVASHLSETLVPSKYVAILDRGIGFWGEDAVLRGIRLAQEGHWEQAAEEWYGILEKNPEHPAAIYNLGVAQERQGRRDNLVRANEAFAKAAKLGNNQLYREALTRTILMLRKK